MYDAANPMQSENDCIECPPGTSCSVGLQAPVNCSAGTYSDLSGDRSAEDQLNKQCLECGDGTYQSDEGMTACRACEPGHYCPRGSDAPRACPAGSYSIRTDLTADTECLLTDPGSFSTRGATAQSPCRPGTFARSSGQPGSCERCPEGQYQSAPGQTACQSCSAVPSLRRQLSTSQPSNNPPFTSPQACSTGQYRSGCGLSSPGGCTPCSAQPNFYFTSDGGLTDSCNTSACDALDVCDVGSYRAGCEASSTGFCTPCTNKNSTEYYTDHGGLVGVCAKATCSHLTCDAGHIRTGSCGVDQTRSNDDYTCEACRPGTYEDQGACIPCSAGSFQNWTAQTECRTCTNGYYCTTGSAAPLPCPGGTTTRTGIVMTSAGDCTACGPGTYCPVGSEQSSNCSAGTYNDREGQQTCDRCSAGEYQDAEGATACKACRPGSFCPVGSTTPIPCPAGTVSNATGLASIDGCQGVGIGFWAPLGSSSPEPCPASGFYCPGAIEDDVNDPPGSRPILVPVGSSFATELVEVVEQQMTLDVDISSFDETAFRQEMAVLYGVDPSLIQVAASAGSTVISISIALPTAGSSATTPAAIQALMGNPSTVASLAQATGLAIANVTAPATATEARSVETVCPRGKWCTAGLIVSCPVDTYNPLEAQDFATACILCPRNSITLGEESTSREQCLCSSGYYDTNSSQAIDENLLVTSLANGSASLSVAQLTAAVVDCKICPVGTICASGATLETLPLVRGYYRIDDKSIDVRRCPDAAANCSTTFGTSACRSTSGCVGGTDVDSLCAPGLSGTFCRTCAQNSTGPLAFYVEATSVKQAHCKECGSSLAQTLALGVALAAGLSVVIALMAWAKEKPRVKWVIETIRPQNMIKILIGEIAGFTPVPPRIRVFARPTCHSKPTCHVASFSSRPSFRAQAST